MIFIYYITLGIIFSIFLDILILAYKLKFRFSNGERFAILFFWPYSLVIFLIELFKSKK